MVAEAGGPLQQLPPLAAPRHHLNLVLLADHHPAPHSLYQTCQPCLTKLTRKLLLWISLTVVLNQQFLEKSFYYRLSLFKWLQQILRKYQQVFSIGKKESLSYSLLENITL